MEFSNKEDIDDGTRVQLSMMKTKADWKQVMFLVLIMIFICLLIFLIFYLVKNKELITTDSINYGIKVYNFSSCSCIDSSGKFINFGGV